MSNAPQDSRWWQASDGKWYPPKDAAPAPGWWLASDGNWYPPAEASAETAAAETATADGVKTDRAPEPAEPNDRGSRTQRTRTTRSKTPPPKAPPAGTPKDAPAATASTPKPAPSKSAPAKSGAASRSTASPKAAPPAAEAPDSPPAPAAKTLPSPRPNPHEGVSPEDQITRRNLASQADAAVLARSRSVAASRLLTAVAKEVNSTRPDPTTGPAPSGEKATGAGSKTPPPTATSARSKQSSAKGRRGSPAATDPLLEVKQSALAADIDHIGERLAIFNDRVELRDRNNAVRQSVMGSDITDIVVQKRLTGAILTIETVEGPVMVAKGLRPEQAEEARSLIMRKTRPAGPVQRGDRPAQRAERPAQRDDRRVQRPAGSTQREDRPSPSKLSSAAPASVRSAPLPPQRPIDEADVLRKLGDLHRLGILTTEEYESKIELVGSLVRGEITLPA